MSGRFRRKHQKAEAQKSESQEKIIRILEIQIYKASVLLFSIGKAIKKYRPPREKEESKRFVSSYPGLD